MKRKTYTRLRTIGLSALLIEAMMLLILLLAQNGASAAVNDLVALSHKGTAWFSGSSDQQRLQAVDGDMHRGGCRGGYVSCRTGGEAFDVVAWTDTGQGTGYYLPAHGGNGFPSQGGGDDSPRGGSDFPRGPFLGFGGGGGFGGPSGGGSGGKNDDLPGTGNPPGGGVDGPSDIDTYYVPPISDTLDPSDLPGDGPGDPPITPAPPAPSVVTVPEPLTAPILVAGLAAMLAARRRKRQANYTAAQ